MPKALYQRVTPSKALSVKQMTFGGKARRKAASGARALVARAAHAQAYREADMLANLAVRGLQLAPGELKSVDVFLNGEDLSSTGSVILLNGIARGDDISERIGRQVTIKSIEINGFVKPKAPEAGVEPETVRIMVVYDRQTNGAALQVAQVLASAAPAANRVIVPKNLENRDRFLILRDMKFGLAAGESVNFMAAPKVVKFYQSLTLPMTFNGGDAGVVADITTGSVYMILLSSAAVGDAHMPTAHMATRVRYSDN